MIRFGAVLSLAVLLVGLGGGCRTMTGRSAAEWMDDRATTAKVKARLAALSASTVTRVHVDTYEGVVYLTGVVPSEAMKQQVEATARNVDAVRQVVTNLQVKALDGTRAASGNDQGAPAASPPTDADDRGPMISPRSLLTRLPGLARVEAAGGHYPSAAFAAYDRTGRVVATVYTVAMRELASLGLEDLRADGRPIDHVSIYVVPAHPDVPDPHFHVVLWHVSRQEAAALF
jgi:hypothetical protein